ncbi:MAG: glycosyltransferase family 2 protein [Puniceicoccaceae bacterium]
MADEGRIPLRDTVLGGFALGLWSGPVADADAVQRALDWEAGVAAGRAFPSVGLVATAVAGGAASARATLAALAVSPGLPLRARIRLSGGGPGPAALDPRRDPPEEPADRDALTRLPALAGRLVFSEEADPLDDLAALAAECDYVGFVGPGRWLQPRGGFALLDFLARERPEVVSGGCVRFDPASGRRTGIERVPSSPWFGALGGNVFGSCPLVRSDAWGPCVEILRNAGADWWDSGRGPWSVGAAAMAVAGVPPRRLRLHVWGGFHSAAGDGPEPESERFRGFLEGLAHRLGAGTVRIRVGEGGGGLRVRPVPRGDAPVGVIVPFRDEARTTIGTLESLAAQSVADRTHLVLVDNGSSPEASAKVGGRARALFDPTRVTVLREEGPFNFARLNNRGESALPPECEALVFANNDIEFTDEADLGRLLSCLFWKEVGLAGGRLVFPDGEIQAAGFRMGPAGPQAVRSPEENALRFREVDGVGFALAVCRRAVFRAVGGLDEERCPNGFGDALFCHRAGRAGWRILCLPDVVVRHHESKSRGRRPEEAEFADLCDEGLPTALYFEDFSVRSGVRDEVLTRSAAPSLGKRIYRSCRAFLREWSGKGGA